ncbi:protein CASC4-like isoform X3 [Pecten maximus]|uniref:protein CASC4-like isoform X3 n=1 Tax=Pecten maximus TaxID=6579 RepID=UPI001458C9DF|nr:protein CASC4-like isoform X3 [Pecten maximus]
MASNGRGSMRAQSRSPPFLVIGLLVALVILGANYWNLSSNNSKLAFEVAELQDQVRQISAKRISAEKKIDSMAESYNRNKDTLAQKESDVKSLNSQVEDKVGELQSLGKEKESCQNNLKNCEDNSNGIQQELLKVKEEVEQLKKKEQEEMSNTQKCDSVCADMRKMIIDAVEKTMGINAVQTLHQAGVDVGEYKDKLGGSQNQAQAEQPQKPEKPEVGEADAAQKPAQPQGGENLEAGKGAANPIQQQPAESNALPQGQINPQPGQGQSNMIPPAQVEGQSNPDNKPKNAEQADTNSLQKNNPAGIQIEANIIPPGQSNPDIPNPQVDQKILPPGNPPAEQGNPKDSPYEVDTHQEIQVQAQPNLALEHLQTLRPHNSAAQDPELKQEAEKYAQEQLFQNNIKDEHTTLSSNNLVSNEVTDYGDQSATTPLLSQDNYDDDTDVGDEKLKFIPGNDKAGSVKAADDSIDTLEKKMKFEDQQK